MYELLDVNNHFEAGILNNFPNVKNYHDRIEQLPNLAAYMKSDKYLARPFNGPYAAWGAGKKFN